MSWEDDYVLRIVDDGKRAAGWWDEEGNLHQKVRRGDGFEERWLNGEMIERYPVPEGEMTFD